MLNPISLGSKLATATVTFSNAAPASIGDALLPGPVADVQALPNLSPDVTVGGTGAAFRAVNVSDRGATSLAINGFTLSGPNAGNFAFTPVIGRGSAPACTVPGLLGYTAAPGVGCQIGVAFRP